MYACQWVRRNIALCFNTVRCSVGNGMPGAEMVGNLAPCALRGRRYVGVMSTGEERGRPIDRAAIFAHKNVPAAKLIDSAVRVLMPSAQHKDTAALFNDRVSCHTVRSWRRGVRSVPQWAIELAAARLMAHGQQILALATMPAQSGPGKGCKAARNLHRYRARKAAERDAATNSQA